MNKKIEYQRKKIEKEKKDKELKGNIKEYIKQKMYKSLSENLYRCYRNIN